LASEQLKYPKGQLRHGANKSWRCLSAGTK